MKFAQLFSVLTFLCCSSAAIAESGAAIIKAMECELYVSTEADRIPMKLDSKASKADEIVWRKTVNKTEFAAILRARDTDVSAVFDIFKKGATVDQNVGFSQYGSINERVEVESALLTIGKVSYSVACMDKSKNMGDEFPGGK